MIRVEYNSTKAQVAHGGGAHPEFPLFIGMGYFAPLEAGIFVHPMEDPMPSMLGGFINRPYDSVLPRTRRAFASQYRI